MKFFYQIKERTNRLDFSVAHRGVVEASDKKEAVKILKEDTGLDLVQKISQKNDNIQNFVLFIVELTSYWEDFWCSKRTCSVCEVNYDILFSKNNNIDACVSYCSRECRDKNYVNKKVEKLSDYISGYGNQKPVIYKITNKNSGKCYIGKTSQVFTLRWYQHFFNSGDCKFHEAIKNSSPSDWIFEIIEVVPALSGKDPLVSEREKFYIDKFNSIEDGYNTADIINTGNDST